MSATVTEIPKNRWEPGAYFPPYQAPRGKELLPEVVGAVAQGAILGSNTALKGDVSLVGRVFIVIGNAWDKVVVFISEKFFPKSIVCDDSLRYRGFIEAINKSFKGKVSPEFIKFLAPEVEKIVRAVKKGVESGKIGKKEVLNQLRVRCEAMMDKRRQEQKITLGEIKADCDRWVTADHSRNLKSVMESYVKSRWGGQIKEEGIQNLIRAYRAVMEAVFKGTWRGVYSQHFVPFAYDHLPLEETANGIIDWLVQNINALIGNPSIKECFSSVVPGTDFTDDRGIAPGSEPSRSVGAATTSPTFSEGSKRLTESKWKAYRIAHGLSHGSGAYKKYRDNFATDPHALDHDARKK
ncbi:MAG: hypothetical protein JSR76_05545 [Verrucomicrobia bacterium]|nr:hypothetical protein [Verrucomicrobiota bacterium]